MEKLFRYGKCIFARPNINNVDEMVEMMNDDEITSMLFSKKKVLTREIEIEWINKHQDDDTFSVYDASSLEYIGNCGFNEIKDNKGEIGITICKKMQGKHYAKDIIRGLIEYGFNKLGLEEIYAIVFSDNVKSLNCITQLGFEEYYRNKNVLERNGKNIDDVYLKIKGSDRNGSKK